MEYFQKGAQAGNPQCNFMLGVYHSTPQGEETTADQAAAFKYFQKAAIKGTSLISYATMSQVRSVFADAQLLRYA
jgi:TPR repeat protein